MGVKFFLSMQRTGYPGSAGVLSVTLFKDHVERNCWETVLVMLGLLAKASVCT